MPTFSLTSLLEIPYIALAFIPALTAFFVAYGVTPLVIRFATKLNIVDDPKKNKHPKVIHTYPVPRAGGLAIYAGIVIASLIFLPADRHLTGILIGATAAVLLGLADDKLNLNPYFRLIVQFLVACVPIAAGIGIPFITK